MKPQFKPTLLATLIAGGFLLSACQPAAEKPTEPQAAAVSAPTAEEATAFVKKASDEMATLLLEVNRADWIASNFITEDTEALSAASGQKMTETVVRLANEADEKVPV